MTKRMLIDDTSAEETRVVIVNGNKVEDVEFESTTRKQIKGNIYLAKVMRIEPSLQAAFVDYGGNRHGFLAFGEIHPDYYNLSAEEMAEIDKEVDDIIEAKKQAIKERELERERYRAEKAAREEERRAKGAEEKAKQEELNSANHAADDASSEGETTTSEVQSEQPVSKIESAGAPLSEENSATNSEEHTSDAALEAEGQEEAANDHKHPRKKRILKKRARKALEAAKKETSAADGIEHSTEENPEKSDDVAKSEDKLVVMPALVEMSEDVVTDDVDETKKESMTSQNLAAEGIASEDDDSDDEDDESDTDFEIQRKLLRIRKMFHRSKIQDVIKEGQVLLVQVVKEERGNKGAALTTYLSLAGRYCVLMPNRIKSGGVSRKITNVADRKRLKGIVKELPLSDEMSMIVRTAGEDKTKADIVRDYNYLIRSWNQIRIDALKTKAPALIHEEGNLIRRALRDMYTKDISEIIVDGEQAYKAAKEFVKILSPSNVKKIKENKKNDLPLFQKFQVEAQLDKLHDTNVQLESGGYLVINPTEALVSIDVNSGRATKEKDLEETALKTNLEAADEIAKQLRMRNLAGLVVVDFIDMEDPKNNQAVEKRMKEAMKKDRARIQIAKMSCFGLLEISRQRMHSSFFESNYQVCPHCHGKGIVRTIESGAMFILRCIEEEGIKNKSSRINLYLPSEFAVYLLNQKRKNLSALEDKYNMEVVICADDSIKNIADYKIERVKLVKAQNEEVKETSSLVETAAESEALPTSKAEKKSKRGRNKKQDMPVEAEIKEPTTEVSVTENSFEAAEEVPQETEESSEDRDFKNRGKRYPNRRRDRRNRFDRRGRNKAHRNRDADVDGNAFSEHKKEKSEAVILYNSHEDIVPQSQPETTDDAKPKEKATWWRKLIKSQS